MFSCRVSCVVSMCLLLPTSLYTCDRVSMRAGTSDIPGLCILLDVYLDSPCRNCVFFFETDTQSVCLETFFCSNRACKGKQAGKRKRDIPLLGRLGELLLTPIRLQRRVRQSPLNANISIFTCLISSSV